VGTKGDIPTALIVEAIFADFSQLRKREERRRGLSLLMKRGIRNPDVGHKL
jgi:hypothetical protein